MIERVKYFEDVLIVGQRQDEQKTYICCFLFKNEEEECFVMILFGHHVNPLLV